MFHRYRLALRLLALSILLTLPLTGCSAGIAGISSEKGGTAAVTPSASGGENVKTIYIAGGCFWGVEKYIAQVQGVLGTEVGYANGRSEDARYGDGSGYTEAVKVDYDPSVAPLPFLLDLFYDVIDPTSVDRQGNDIGTEYRTGIYYTDPADGSVVEQSLAQLQAQYAKPLAIESGPLTTYTRAEEYHQKYLDKNPGGYCHIPRKLFEAAAAARPE